MVPDADRCDQSGAIGTRITVPRAGRGPELHPQAERFAPAYRLQESGDRGQADRLGDRRR